MVAGATNVTLRAPRNGATVITWSLPAYCCVMRSGSIMMSMGENLVVIGQRIATALNIRDGDTVGFRFDATGDVFHLKVKVMKNLSSDVLIHDFYSLNLIESHEAKRWGDIVTFNSGRMLILPQQNMWAGMKVIRQSGSAMLLFDGASRKNPKGPAGYGFHIITESNEELVEGYGYAGMDRTSNEMEYEGLIEGLIWATRLDLVKLTICGDSELVIKQMMGIFTVANPRMKALHSKARKILQEHCEFNRLEELEYVNWIYCPRHLNEIADNLANKAIVTRKSATTVNWPNVNKL